MPKRGPGSDSRMADDNVRPTSRTPSMSETLPYATFMTWVSSIVVAASG